MMRPASITILPMLAAAVLVMVGGERMSRRSAETRIPADRERLFDFTDTFRTEIERLDSLYRSHLEELAEIAAEADGNTVSPAAKEISGVILIRVFREKGSDLSFPVRMRDRLPEIEMKGRKTPLNAKSSLLLDPRLLSGLIADDERWLHLPDPKLRAYCARGSKNSLIVILVDLPAVQSQTAAHLAEWIETPLAPLREAGERTRVEIVGGPLIAETKPEKHGPAAAVIPLRTDLADWQIMAWDRVNTTASHDPATLAVATTMAALLLAAGVVMFVQQKRSLRLAADRVSFVNRVSHELGTPLTNLALNLDLATELLSSRPQDARNRLGLVGEEIARLSRLVANVLTFSHKERGTLQLRAVRCIPADVVGRVLANFRPALERRGIEIESEIGGEDPVSLDPDALGQIVGNLLSNVEKYASPGRWLGISCSQKNEMLEVVVRDRGPGIGPAHRERVFNAFERYCDATNEGSSGTGLGLTIARDLAGKMGGTLELLNDASGAAFRLEVPAPPILTIVSEDHPAP